MLITDDIAIKISGADVPKAIIVNPIVSSLKPSSFANNDELSMNLFAPHTRIPIAKASQKKLANKAISYFTSNIVSIDYVELSKIQYHR